MKKIYYSVLTLTLAASAWLGYTSLQPGETEKERIALRQKLREHPYTLMSHSDMDKRPSGGKPAAPDRAWEQDYLRTMDPSIGRPTPEVLVGIMADMAVFGGQGYGLAPGAAQSPWLERGPNNVGGRTRGLVWDPNSATGLRVWAGGVNGGLWFNTNISDPNTSWTKVNDFWSNIAITCIAFDPVNTQIMYVGTGEGHTAGGSSGARGAGIFKSTDGGANWTSLGSSSGFYYVNDIVVRNEGGSEGVVYAAVDGRFHAGDFHGLANAGIRRSNNGGSSWTNVSPNVPSESIKLIASDLEIGANGRIWAGSKVSSFSAGDKGGGRVLYSDNGTTWTISNTTSVGNNYGRVAIACAPSDSNVVYAIVENNNQCETIIRTGDHGSNWATKAEPEDADNGIPSTDFTRGQAWYDLVVAVDPNNADVLVAGGIDLFRSTNGAGSWTQISKWSDNNNLANLDCSNVHADQHALVFQPGSSSTLINGNDGGVYYTSSLSTAGSSDVIGSRNKGYNVTQYYSCATHPGTGSNIYLAGAQDNGTQRYSSAGVNSTTEVYGGDGGYCFIDQSDPTVAICSYVYNNFYKSTNTGQTFTVDLIEDNNTGKFINPADYHDGDNVLYSGKEAGQIWRIRNVTSTPATPETMTIAGMVDEVSHIRASPYSSTIFIGTDVGEIYRVNNANGTHSATDITGAGLPAGTVSCIEIGASDNELLVTYFNYGVISVWYTNNGGTDWVNKEGNLPNMPVRWALFNPNNRNEVILATDLGVWSTSDLSSGSVVWASSNAGLANTRVDMLQIRSVDQVVIAATHGRGLFSSNAFAAQKPAADFSVSSQNTCVPQKVSFTDLSAFDPTEWLWSFSPGTMVYEDGTGDTSRNPVVRFTAPGTYQVTLTATNGIGSDSEVKAAYVTVSAALVPAVVINANNNPSCIGSGVNFTATPTNGGASPVFQWKINGVNVGSNSPNFSSVNLIDGDIVTCELSSSDLCALTAPMASNEITMEIWAKPVVGLTLTTPNTCISTDPFTLAGGSPSGGTYSGTSVNNNVFDPVIAGFGGHTITYTFTDANGCANSATDVINVSNLPNKPDITRVGNTLTSSEVAAFYEWTLNGVVIPSAINRNHTMTSGGTYTVKVTNGFGCSNLSAPSEEFMVGVGELSGMSWNMYPNPSNGTFTLAISLPESCYLNISLFDVNGKKVFEQNEQMAAGEITRKLDLSLAPGTYYIRLSDGLSEWRKPIQIVAD